MYDTSRPFGGTTHKPDRKGLEERRGEEGGEQKNKGEEWVLGQREVLTLSRPDQISSSDGSASTAVTGTMCSAWLSVTVRISNQGGLSGKVETSGYDGP